MYAVLPRWHTTRRSDKSRLATSGADSKIAQASGQDSQSLASACGRFHATNRLGLVAGRPHGRRSDRVVAEWQAEPIGDFDLFMKMRWPTRKPRRKWALSWKCSKA